MLNSIIIAEPIIENLMSDFDIDEDKAVDIFYSSNTFAKFANESTEKEWQEIYELLKQELK